MSRLLSILGVALSVSALACGGTDKKDDPAGSAAAVVTGTLTFPGAADDKPYGVELLTSPGSTAVASASGRTTAATTLAYSIADVPVGTYFLLAFVDVDESAGTGSTPGDYAGWYGGDMNNANPPAAANVAVPETGTLTIDLMLVER